MKITGQQGTGAFDGSLRQDPQANLDFAYAAVGRVAELANRAFVVPRFIEGPRTKDDGYTEMKTALA